MKRVILVAAILGIFVFHLSAQTKTEKIKELFRIMKVDETMKSTFDNMFVMMQKRSPNLNNTQKDSISYKIYLKEELLAMLKKIMDNDMVVLYDKHFTIEEIQKYIEFYKTPEAQKMQRVMPEIQKELMLSIMNKYVPELLEKMKRKEVESNKS